MKYNTRQKYGKGWFFESHRHSLARQGIETVRKSYAREALGDVWKLESPQQYIASDSLSMIAEQAMKGDRKAQNFLRMLWDNESWSSIKKKLETEGSAYYVWWMDGINKIIREKLNYSKQTDFIHGGLADNLSDNIFDSEQLRKGIKVELEHTDNPKIAKEIAKDHLKEFPRYYDALEEMEKKLKKKKTNYSKMPLEFISNEIAVRILSGIRYGKELKPEELVKEYNLSEEEKVNVIRDAERKVSEHKSKMLNIIRKKRIGINYSKEKKLTEFGIKNPTKGKQVKFKVPEETQKKLKEDKYVYWVEDKDDPSVEFEDTVTKSLNKVKEYKKETEKELPGHKFVIKKEKLSKLKKSGINYQEEVIYEPTTIEISKEIEKIEEHPTLTDEEKRERIERLKEKWKEGLKREFEVSKKIGKGVGKVGKGFLSTVITGLAWEPGKEEEQRRPINPLNTDYSKKNKKR